MHEMLIAAIGYAELGYKVFPCAAATNPAPLTPHGFKDATSDVEQIERWWTRHPHACIGLAAGGLLVVDIDAPPNPWLADQPDLARDLIAAPTSLTPGGGRHHIFRRPEGKQWGCTVGKLAPHVDTRTDGGYIVAPPSVRPDGSYRWLEGCELDVAPDRLPQPPAWLVEQLDNLAAGSPRIASPRVVANQIPDGQRNATLARLGGTMRRVGMGQAEINAALQRTNADRCSPPLSPAEVERIAASIARYAPDDVAVAVAENHWGQMYEIECNDDHEPPDPGPIPDRLLRVPGFVSEVMDHCLATAPYPNVALAFCGALALQAVLAGRKVRDQADNRTNLYLLALAFSSVGKDWPRKLNLQVLHRIGLINAIGDKFASGEGLQDSLFLTPSMLYQTDEIDGLLQSINKARDARHENIMGTLLTMYSSANSIYPMRRKAGKEQAGVIDQPCLVVYGTAIPTHYYEALSDRMLTNGFFARMLIIESGVRRTGQNPRIIDAPASIMDVAQWWADFNPGAGNLENWHPQPRTVEADDDAHDLLAEARRTSEAEYSSAESGGDPVGTTVWGRVSEQVRKLALLYAISANHQSPRINAAAVQWATELMLHQTRRMLFMARNHVAENPFHAECLKLLRKLRAAPDRQIAHSVLLKRMKTDAKTFQELINTLEQQGDVLTLCQSTAGRPQRYYRLLCESGGEKVKELLGSACADE